MKRRANNGYSVALILILLIGLGLRVWGIRWGLPTSGRIGSYHPDELLVIGAASAVDLPNLQLNPHFYNYPTLFVYLASLTLTAANRWGLLRGGADLYLSVRLLAALFGTATIYALYVAAKRLYGPSVGLLAAALLALAPLHVQYSHFAAVDVPAVFFVTAALAASARLLMNRKATSFILAGALAGLAAGTKYNCGLVFLSVVAAGLLPVTDQAVRLARRSALVLVALAAAIAALVLATPGVVLWPSEFWNGFSFELRHAASGHGYVFANTGPGWLYTLRSSLAHGLGWPLAALAIAAAIFALVRRRTQDLVVLAFLLPYYALISLSAVRFARYAIPLFPPLAILTAAAAVALWERLGSRRWLRGVCAAVFGVVALYTTTYSTAIDRLFTQPDPRDRAARWASQYLPNGTSIAFPTIPWFYSPPLAPGFGKLKASDRFAAMSESRYELIADESQDWYVTLLRDRKPGYLIITDYEKIDAVRAGAPGAAEYLKLVDERYAPVAVFESKLLPPLFGQTASLPHDMRYAAPRIEVFKRKWPT